MRWDAQGDPAPCLHCTPPHLCQGENLLYCLEAAPAQPALTQGKQRILHCDASAPTAAPTPRLSCLSAVTQCLTEGPTRGLATVPRLALDVMACEVLRVLQLTDTFLIPVSYIVPRKVSVCGAIKWSLSSKLGPCDPMPSCPAAFPVTHCHQSGVQTQHAGQRCPSQLLLLPPMLSGFSFHWHHSPEAFC